MPADHQLPVAPSRRSQVPVEIIERRIHVVRSQKVMLDSDLAELYQVETKALNRAVKRNAARFPSDFMFRLNAREAESLRCQIGTSNVQRGGRRYLPYAFTEHGVAMLSSVLNSDRAVQMNILIIRVFLKLRELLATHTKLAAQVEKLEAGQRDHAKAITLIMEDIQGFQASVRREFRRLQEPRPKKSRIGFVPN